MEMERCIISIILNLNYLNLELGPISLKLCPLSASLTSFQVQGRFSPREEIKIVNLALEKELNKFLNPY